MKWYNVVILGLLILGFIFVLGYQLGINANKDEQVYQSKIDSLKSALKSQIEVYNFKLDSLNKDIDSLDKVKNKIIIKYKDAYEKVIDVDSITNDSIIMYISTKYIIKGDTIVGYTLDENRSIALLFMKGEMYEELYFTQNEILAKKDSIINTQYYHIKFQDSVIVVTTNTIDKLEKINNDNKAIIEKEKRKSKTNGWIAGGSGILNLILILLLCL